MFTSGQVSEMLEVPPSTLRRYVKQFGDQLSSTAQRRRGRRFTAEDVATLARTRELLAHGRKPSEVAALLQVVGEDSEIAESQALALIPSISQALTEALDTARSLRVEVEDLADRQTSTDQRLAELEAWLRLPWYSRLFGRPPED